MKINQTEITMFSISGTTCILLYVQYFWRSELEQQQKLIELQIWRNKRSRLFELHNQYLLFDKRKEHSCQTCFPSFGRCRITVLLYYSCIISHIWKTILNSIPYGAFPFFFSFGIYECHSGDHRRWWLLCNILLQAFTSETRTQALPRCYKTRWNYISLAVGRHICIHLSKSFLYTPYLDRQIGRYIYILYVCTHRIRK